MKGKLAIFVLLLAGAWELAAIEKPKDPPGGPAVVLPKPLYRFEVQGIKRIFTSPSKVTFQVQYYISPTYPRDCYIGAYIPDKAHISANFALIPAGRAPLGVPKGQKGFADNVTFDMKYIGTGDYASTAIEVVIYNTERTLGSSVIAWGQTWKRFDIQGIKRVTTRPEYVKFQVQYFIDPDYANACYISAYIPDESRQNAGFSFLPAGRVPVGVPKGQHVFADNVWFDASYSGAAPFTSTDIEVTIYESGRNLRKQIIHWGQVWSAAGH